MLDRILALRRFVGATLSALFGVVMLVVGVRDVAGGGDARDAAWFFLLAVLFGGAAYGSYRKAQRLWQDAKRLELVRARLANSSRSSDVSTSRPMRKDRS